MKEAYPYSLDMYKYPDHALKGAEVLRPPLENRTQKGFYYRIPNVYITPDETYGTITTMYEL